MPAPGCIPAGRGLLHVRESSAGHERLKILMKAFETPTPPSAFGNPVFGPSAYDVCVYDDADGLTGALRIDRAEDTCGARGRSCWRGMGGGGFKFADPDLVSHGARRALLRGGDVGAGRFVLLAKNAVQRGRTAMPTGITTSLAGSVRATVQLHVSDGACFELDASDVRVASPVVFRAVGY